jgi:hypothetical protein
MHDAILQSLHNRILDDAVFCRRKLGRIPEGGEIDAAIGTGNILERAADAVALTLDGYESELWDALAAAPPPEWIEAQAATIQAEEDLNEEES